MEDPATYLQKIKSEFEFKHIKGILENINEVKVLAIGDTILDEYIFVKPKGRAIKDPILSVGHINNELYAGGIIAIANHLSSFVRNITIVTLIGDVDPKVDFLEKSVSKNTQLKLFVKDNSPTIIKKRYVDAYKNNKLFKVEYLNDKPISADLTEKIINYLDQEIPKYDLVIVGDFGHGFLNEIIRRKLEEKSAFLAVNTQSNSSNMGYNYFNQYKKVHFITMDDEEVRLPLSKRYEKIEDVIQEVHFKYKFSDFVVTRGRNGCLYVKDGKIHQAPILISSVKDTVGAGDALFAISSLFVYAKADQKLIPFIANCAGGIAANIIGNKESITKEILLNFIEKKYEEVDNKQISQYFDTVNSTLNNLNKGNVTTFVQLLLETYNNDRSIYIFGNGGSAATASHFCGDLIKGVSYGLEKRFKAICLNDNLPALMAIANDISYDDIFVEQLKNFANKDDLVIGISGSGNSRNVVKAMEYAKIKGAKTVAICGYKGGKIKEISDLSIHAEVDDMEISEDIQNLVIIHCVKRMLTNELNNNHSVGEEYAKRIK